MLSFNKLWENHPGRNSRPCKFINQCAIRMGVALEKSGINLSAFKGQKCWYKKHSPRHILRAQELANWISKNPQLFGKKTVYKNVEGSSFIGQKGIVFIKNGWGSTDHIDIWDGSVMKGGYSEYFTKGEEVWFWKLN